MLQLKIGIFVLRDTQIHFPTGVAMGVTIPAAPQFEHCEFDTAAKVVVTGNISLSCQLVQINWMELHSVGWRPEDLTVSIPGCLLHLAAKYLGLVVIHPNNYGKLEFLG